MEFKFHIQRVPTLHTFDGPRYPKNKKYLEKLDDDNDETAYIYEPTWIFEITFHMVLFFIFL